MHTSMVAPNFPMAGDPSANPTYRVCSDFFSGKVIMTAIIGTRQQGAVRIKEKGRSLIICFCKI